MKEKPDYPAQPPSLLDGVDAPAAGTDSAEKTAVAGEDPAAAQAPTENENGGELGNDSPDLLEGGDKPETGAAGAANVASPVPPAPVFGFRRKSSMGF